jgi:Leucine-rich repeat (LRR) protein
MFNPHISGQSSGYFDYNATEPTYSGAAQVQQQPLSLHDMDFRLSQWMHQGYFTESRVEAKNRIMAAFQGDSEELNLRDLKLRSLPAEIGQLTQLRKLIIDNNEFPQLPPEIGQLNQLRELSMDCNELTQLPPEIGQLTQLRELSMECNEITQLPPEIGQLKQLIELKMSDNKLTQLPPEIGQLRQLHRVDLSTNRLTQLPSEIRQLSNVEIFSLLENQFTQFPPEILQLSKLRCLYLDGNELTQLPPEIGRMNSLQCLGLSNNALQNLPVEIGQLSQLEELYLQDCELVSLPEEMNQLVNLTHLFFDENLLTGLSLTFSSFCLPLGLKDFWENRLFCTTEDSKHVNTLKDAYGIASYLGEPLGRLSIAEDTSEPTHILEGISNLSLGQLQDWLSINPTQLLHRMEALLEMDLDAVVTLPQLPQQLQAIPECRDFFNAFNHSLNGHYFTLQSLTSGALLKDPSRWAQTMSIVLQLLSFPGSGLVGTTIAQIDQQRMQAKAAEKAFAVLKPFPTPEDFIKTARYAAVLFTKRLASELQTSSATSSSSALQRPKSLKRKLSKAYKKLQTTTGFQAKNPWEQVPLVHQASTLFMKALVNNPEVRAFSECTDLNPTVYCKRLAKLLVNTVLGEGGHTLDSSDSPPRTPTERFSAAGGSFRRGNSEVQELKNQLEIQKKQQQAMQQQIEAQQRIIEQLLHNQNLVLNTGSNVNMRARQQSLVGSTSGQTEHWASGNPPGQPIEGYLLNELPAHMEQLNIQQEQTSAQVKETSPNPSAIQRMAASGEARSKRNTEAIGQRQLSQKRIWFKKLWHSKSR